MDAPPRPAAGVAFGILGPLRITVDGRELELTSPTQRRLLVALLIERGAVVSTDRLADLVWGSELPEDPAGSLHTHVSRLRGLLADAAGQPARELVVTRPPGYALAVDPGRVDAGRFERLIDEARGASGPQAALDLLGQALQLWRGRPLAELDDEQVMAEATRLEQLRTRGLELRAEALLALGRFPEAVSALEPAVGRHPLREQLRAQLMVALYRCGRQADALATYRALRDQLVEELGAEPSAALRRLERAILQQEEDLPWPSPAAPGISADAGAVGFEAAGRSLGAGPSALPEALTSFVGRAGDVRDVAAALGRDRLVSLVGPGGVGKSRLAVRVARAIAGEYRDGVRLCELIAADDPETVSDVVATALGVLPGEEAGTEPALVELLRGQELLLVLDNCEHVLAGVSGLAERIVRSCPGVDVLATSRRPLRTAGEHVRRVDPLEVGDAVGLFCDRAAAAEPSFDGDGVDREVVAHICRALDGLPLAVELAAARVRAMTPADIAERIDRRFRLLTDGPRTGPSRHRSLQAVIDWSYALLAEPTRRLFERLTVFVGGLGLDAAEQVCAGDELPVEEVAGRLSELIDHSLVAVDRSGAHARYRLLETLRAYGWARLEERGELSAWRRRHGEHFVALAGQATAGLQGPEEADWVRSLDSELANLRAAGVWARADGRVDLALRLPAGLHLYAYYRLRDEIYDWALHALELPGAGDHPARPGAVVAAGIGLMQRGHLEQAREHGRRALEAAPEEGVVLRALQLLAEVSLYQGRLEETDRRGEGVIERARATGSAYTESLGYLYRVYAATYGRRIEDAWAHLEQGWRVVEATGNPTLRAAYHHLEGEVRLDADPDAARQAFARAIDLAGTVGNRFVEGVARVSVASLEARHGEADDALAAFRDIIDDWRTSGDWVHMWTTLHNLVVLLERVGAQEPAAVLHGAVGTATTGAEAFGADAQRLAAVAAELRRSLGEEVFAAAAARGGGMADDETVAYALEEIDGLLADGSAEVA